MVALRFFLVTLIPGATASSLSANPIRKVVNLLQALQKKVAEEGEKAEDLHQKFMCYCSKSEGGLDASISAAETKIPDVQSKIQSASAQKANLEADVKAHQVDRDAAKAAMAQATAIREKELATYNKNLGDNKQNIEAILAAVAALEKGMAGAFLQSSSAARLRTVLMGKQDMVNADRQDVMAFLSGGQSSEYAPSSGEITGILKQMADEMTGDQKGLIDTEQDAVRVYSGLMAAKKKEVAALTEAFESKSTRIGDLGVQIAMMKNDLEDTQEGLAADRQFTADLKANCGKREAIHAEEKKMRAAETVALADTIKILNDDDALELFKKTLPGSSASFVEVQETSADRRLRARVALESVQTQHHNLDFILLALRGRKIGFSKVVSMIDNLVASLKTEQQDDAHKKEYCEAQFDHADDNKKVLQNSISDLGASIEDAKEGMAALAEEIAALKAGIAALDQSVSEATSQRKTEAAEYKDLVSSNTAARELILFAKNRLQKFYNPKLYKAAPKRELSEDDRIYENQGGYIPADAPGGIANTGIAAFFQIRDAPAPPPAVAAAYVKKSEGSAGVMSMMDLLVQDLDKETTEAGVEEKNAKEEYEAAMSEAAGKRTQDSKALTDKEAARANLEGSLESTKSEKKATTKELMGTLKYIQSLKGECDWLLKYFDARSEARTDEIASLENAKAVLSGADYSLVQQGSGVRHPKFLGRQ